MTKQGGTEIKFKNGLGETVTARCAGEKVCVKVGGKRYKRDAWMDENGNVWVYFYNNEMHIVEDGELSEDEAGFSTYVLKGKEVLRRYQKIYK